MLTKDEFKKKIKIKYGYLPEGFHKMWEDYKNMCAVTTTNDLTESVSTSWFKLAPLPKAVPCMSIQECVDKYVPQQEGKTPMRYNDNYASANVITTTAQSDTTVQRNYLLDRLNRAEWPKQQSFTKLFNLHIDNAPKTYKELIDAIKNDKFSLDAKAVKKVDSFSDEDSDYPEGYNPYGAFFGIVWEGATPDPEGYQEAVKVMHKQFTAAKDIIMSGVYADGLKALQDFEAWLPETGVKAN